MKSKKAGIWTFDVAFAIMWLIFLSAVILFTVAMINMMAVNTIDIKQAETEILSYRILYSFNGINYKNVDIQRNYPGVIDVFRFKNETLEKFFDYREEIAAKITLRNLDTNEENVIFLNGEWYKRWKPLANRQGPGGATISQNIYPVVIKRLNEENQGLMRVEVVMPNA